MFEDINDCYIEGCILTDTDTYNDIIVGQLTYRVYHFTESSMFEYRDMSKEDGFGGYGVEFDCDIQRIVLLSQDGDEITDVTNQLPDWIAVKFALTIEEKAGE